MISANVAHFLFSICRGIRACATQGGTGRVRYLKQISVKMPIPYEPAKQNLPYYIAKSIGYDFLIRA